MTLLSRKADYALLILSYLHSNQVGGTARGIAEKLGISRAFVANILKELCQNGFVQSHRGVKGGYALARDAGSITLAELLESLDDGLRLALCSSGTDHEHASCSLVGSCLLKGPIAEVHGRLLDVLRGVTLGQLFDPSGKLPSAAAQYALPMLGRSVQPGAEPCPA